MNQQRHSDAVLAHLLEQLHIRSETVIAEKLQEQGASFDKWAQEHMQTTDKLNEQLRIKNLECQDLGERFNKQSRLIKLLWSQMDAVYTPEEIVNIQRSFDEQERQRDEEFAEAIAQPLPVGTPDGLPVEPTPEDANHRD